MYSAIKRGPSTLSWGPSKDTIPGVHIIFVINDGLVAINIIAVQSYLAGREQLVVKSLLNFGHFRE